MAIGETNACLNDYVAGCLDLEDGIDLPDHRLRQSELFTAKRAKQARVDANDPHAGAEVDRL